MVSTFLTLMGGPTQDTHSGCGLVVGQPQIPQLQIM
jgi:hypothetical protein